MPDNPRPYIPAEDEIVKIAKAIQESSSPLWDFGEHYYLLNLDSNFNYQALSRAIKEQHGIDLFPPSVASKLRKVYEKYCIDCQVPKSRLRLKSPYYLYEIAVRVDLTPKNVEYWLSRSENTTRAELLAELDAREDSPKRDPSAMLRMPEAVYQNLQEAANHTGMSVGVKQLSQVAFLEFIAELILNSPSPRLRRLWDAIHGELAEEEYEDDE